MRANTAHTRIHGTCTYKLNIHAYTAHACIVYAIHGEYMHVLYMNACTKHMHIYAAHASVQT